MSSDKPENPNVRIHIDGKAYHSPTPTSAEHLYSLAKVEEGQVVYKEVQGNHEDKLIARDDPEVVLHEDEHFYSSVPHKVEHNIVVNGRKKEVAGTKISFEQVVKLAFPAGPPTPETVYTVGYYAGPPKNPKGTMTEGQVVKIKDGMVFDVTETSRS